MSLHQWIINERINSAQSRFDIFNGMFLPWTWRRIGCFCIKMDSKGQKAFLGYTYRKSYRHWRWGDLICKSKACSIRLKLSKSVKFSPLQDEIFQLLWIRMIKFFCEIMEKNVTLSTNDLIILYLFNFLNFLTGNVMSELSKSWHFGRLIWLKNGGEVDGNA